MRRDLPVGREHDDRGIRDLMLDLRVEDRILVGDTVAYRAAEAGLSFLAERGVDEVVAEIGAVLDFLHPSEADADPRCGRIIFELAVVVIDEGPGAAVP